MSYYGNGNAIANGHILPEDDVNVFSSPAQHGLSTMKLVEGRLPSAADEVLVGFPLQQLGVQLGSVITMPFDAPSQLNAFLNGNPTPRGPEVRFHVVGVEANVTDFPSGNSTTYNLFTSAAFDRGEGLRALRIYGALVRMRHGAADLPQFQFYLSHHLSDAEAQSADEGVTAVERSIHPQAVGWWLFALLAGLVGVALVGQALARQSVIEADTYPTLEALGVRPTQLLALGMARAAAIALAGAVGAVALAFAVSPLTPVGEARIAEPATGFALDVLVLGLGALSTTLVTVLLAVLPAWQSTRLGRTRRSRSLEPPAPPSSSPA